LGRHGASKRFEAIIWGETLMHPRAIAAEAIGTFMLMASILGSAFYAFPNAGILGVAFSIGLTVMACAYALGHISGGHFNPAVTAGLVAAGRFPMSQALTYIIAQIAGAIFACMVFKTLIGNTGTTFAANMIGKGFSMGPVLAIEFVLTAFFLVVITGATSKKAPAGFAPIAIGLTLAVIHIMSIPVSNTSVNPARSIGPALFGGPEALSQLWMFIAAPIAGGVFGGALGKWLQNE
jgi:aquaporin Z